MSLFERVVDPLKGVDALTRLDPLRRIDPLRKIGPFRKISEAETSIFNAGLRGIKTAVPGKTLLTSGLKETPQKGKSLLA